MRFACRRRHRNQRHREALDELRGLDERIKALQAAARKASQAARRVELSLQLQQFRREAAQLKGSL